MLGIEAALREIVRDEVRKELRHHREEMLVAVRLQDRPPPETEPDPDELLTVEQVAHLLKVIPDTVEVLDPVGRAEGESTRQRHAPGTQVPSSPIGPGRICRVIRAPARAAGGRRGRDGRASGGLACPRA